MKKYYLYRHIRLDKNEPFYIGIGKVSSNIKDYSIDSEHYRRAYSNINRNKHWRNIAQMTNYTVEILFESDNRQLIIQKEIEFIALYGREDLKQGSLVNMTNGGEGRDGHKLSDETKTKMSVSAKRNITIDRKIELVAQLNKNHPTKGRFGKNHFRSITVYQYDLFGNFIQHYESLSLAASQTNSHVSKISNCLNGKRKTTNGYIWSTSNSLTERI
jgi:hypothetical protein